MVIFFPGGPGLAGTKMSPFWIYWELRTMEAVVATGAIVESSSHTITTNKPPPKFLQAECPSCRPTG